MTPTNKFPTLFKLTATGALQYWTIAVQGCDIITKYGQEGTQNEQATCDTIKTGKNLGKANETTAEEQAYAEAQARWTKQVKKNYVEDRERALVGETDIVGGADVMLAQKYRDHSAKISWPAAVQPKLDGIRCIAILKNNRCTLWSRTKKPITGIPHIARAVEQLAEIAGIPDGSILDGEAFTKDKMTFEKITSYVRQQEPIEGHETVQYWCYDIIGPQDFSERFRQLSVWFQLNTNPSLVLVETHLLVKDEAEIMEWFYHYLKEGFEGSMARNLQGGYERKRSYNLQKMKDHLDEDFEIIGVNEGRGKLTGHVGSFRCLTKQGIEFDAKMDGKIEYLKELWEHPNLWQGKLATVRYQNLTSASGVPRFPILKSLREPGL